MSFGAKQRGVEGAAAGDEAELGSQGGAVDGLGREAVLLVQPYLGDPEHHERAVGAAHVDLVAGAEQVQPVASG